MTHGEGIHHRGTEAQRDPVSRGVIGAAIEVHRVLGPGLLESVYEECICRELELNKLRFKRQVELPIEYKGTPLNVSYRIDLVVEDALVVELKAVEELLPVHEAQLLTYLRLSRLPTGLLINFNVPVLKQGIKRMKL
jgi:GxxExxY protein